MAEAVATRQIVMGIVQAVLALAYPLIVWVGLARFEPRVLALIVMAFAALRWGIARFLEPSRSAGGKPVSEALRSLALPALMIGGIVGAVLIWNDAIGLLLMPVAISLAFLFTFGGSLISGPPMVERFARLQVDTLSREEVEYCRRVTWVWCGFFVVNAGLAAMLAALRMLDAWALYTGLISYLLMGTLFASEYVYRHWRFRRYVGALTDPVLIRFFPPREASFGGLHASLRAERRPVEQDEPDEQSPSAASSRGRRQLQWRVPESLAVWPGHFPEQALVPGVLQLEWIAREVEAWQGKALRLVRIERLKFKAPVYPGDVLTADLRAEEGGPEERVYRVELRVRDELATTLQITFADPAIQDRKSEGERERGSEVAFPIWDGEWPAPSRLLPHAGNMLWLHSVLGHSQEETVSRVRTEDLGVFQNSEGGAGAWLALEWMAQTVAAHDGVRRDAVGAGIRPGMLLGTQRMENRGEGLAPGGEYAVRVRHVFGGDSGMVSYDCEVFDMSTRRLEAKARLACRVGTPGAPLI